MAYDVTLIPGDGTGPEITEATRRVLEATGVQFNWDVQHVGVDVMEKEGTPLPQRALDSLARTKLGINGPVTTPIGTGFRSVNVALRKSSSCTRACGHAGYPGVRTRLPTRTSPRRRS
jgi:isocitrate dehydrogenase (NAD+)